MVSLWDICLVKFREIGDMWLPLLFLSLLGGASGLEVGVKSLGTWFVEHPQFAVALPGESVFFDCKTNSFTKSWLTFTLSNRFFFST